MKTKFVFAIALLLVSSVAAAAPGFLKPASKPTPPDVALSAYIERVRAESAAAVHTPGSIWSDDGRLTRLSSDLKATHIARCNFDCRLREPCRIDRRCGEELPRIERQLRNYRSLRECPCGERAAKATSTKTPPPRSMPRGRASPTQA